MKAIMSIKTIKTPKNKSINICDINKPIKLNNIEDIISNNTYVKNCKTNKEKDINSISYLLDPKLNMSQSDCIKFGIGLEHVIKDIILLYNQNLISIKEPNKKGQKEKDHLFMDCHKRIIYYSEIKSNINLDTEKSLATYEKCLYNKKNIEKKYPDYKVIMFLTSVRYYTNEIIPNTISNKYSKIIDSLLGINEYYKALSVPIYYNNEDEFKIFLNLLANKMFNE
jgi:hypothetical protein